MKLDLLQTFFVIYHSVTTQSSDTVNRKRNHFPGNWENLIAQFTIVIAQKCGANFWSTLSWTENETRDLGKGLFIVNM